MYAAARVCLSMHMSVMGGSVAKENLRRGGIYGYVLLPRDLPLISSPVWNAGDAEKGAKGC